MKKVSVIVPVYNAEKTISQCLNSLVNQSLDNIEIIAVNDASVDNSIKILREYEKRYVGKVKIINLIDNHGPGGARNYAIEQAKGEYIGFVDSDDIVTFDMYEKLYGEAKVYDYDIVDGGFYFEKEDRAIIYTVDEYTGKLDDYKRNQLIVSGGYICTKIFRASMIKYNKNFLFRENVVLEDSEFITYAFATAESIGNVKEILYKYSYNADNTSESNNKSPIKYYESIYAAVIAIYDKLSVVDNYNDIKKAVEYEMTQLILYGIIVCIQNMESEEYDFSSALVKLVGLKNAVISIDYEQNEYIVEKITGQDYDLLKKF